MMLITRASKGFLVVTALLLLAVPAAAQTGGVRGKVIDQNGKPVEDAEIVIQSKDSARRLQIKSNRNGEFVQIGLFPGEYTVTASKDNLKTQIDIRVSLGDPQELTLQLTPGGAAPEQIAEQQKQLEKLRAAFNDGVTAIQSKDYDTAIAKFNEAIAIAPNCADCYYNLGVVYAQKEDLPNAAAAYEKAGELRPNHAETWNNLVSVYNKMGESEKAMAASQKAVAAASSGSGGASATSLYNQGVILWNQNKYAEARDKFEAATKADPKHAEAQYRLAMAHLNLGDMEKATAAFEAYLQVAPNGPHAEEAKQFLDSMKKQ
ncbi:MAG TPA: tetratricopeptide repeat protein [Vicinamibacterales bacterium]|nr:tetratricopeptide repeat protein [Vicinamibacterales bacterium]